MHRRMLQSRKAGLLFLREESREMILKMHLLSIYIGNVRNTVFRGLPQTSEPVGRGPTHRHFSQASQEIGMYIKI